MLATCVAFFVVCTALVSSEYLSFITVTYWFPYMRCGRGPRIFTAMHSSCPHDRNNGLVDCGCIGSRYWHSSCIV